MTKIQINNTLRDMTAEEQAEYDARQVTPPTAFEQSMIDLRQDRNKLLLECDWTDLPNAVLSDEKKTEWQTYRTNLRDITNGLTTVEQAKAVEFPEKPSE
tara:strand:+ start:176 stop:475 length:300 start_codon:yes stop_codon:yes gene_type:complete